MKLFVQSWSFQFDVHCFLDTYCEITVSNIYNCKRIYRIIWFTHCTVGQMFMNGGGRLAMLPDPCGQMPFCFTDVKRICIMQTLKVIYHTSLLYPVYRPVKWCIALKGILCGLSWYQKLNFFKLALAPVFSGERPILKSDSVQLTCCYVTASQCWPFLHC